MTLRCSLFICSTVFAAAAVCSAQSNTLAANLGSAGAAAVANGSGSIPEPHTKVVDRDAAADYLLGPDDQVTVFCPDLDEFNDKTFRIDAHGDLNLPLAGRVHAAGVTVDVLEQRVAANLKRVLKAPDVVITIAEYHSQPVSILGAVGTPGVRQIEGGKTLFEVISLAGGLRTDAGNTINVTRSLKYGAIPLPNAKTDSTGRYSVASVSVKSILNAMDPAQNIEVMPGDVISVSKADVVYAVGYVVKPGGYQVGENDRLTALQVLSLAEGLQKTAAPEKAMILRVEPGSSERKQVPVNVKEIMSGKGSDVPLQADDILFIPDSKAKAAGARALETVISLTTGMAIYGRY